MNHTLSRALWMLPHHIVCQGASFNPEPAPWAMAWAPRGRARPRG